MKPMSTIIQSISKHCATLLMLLGIGACVVLWWSRQEGSQQAGFIANVTTPQTRLAKGLASLRKATDKTDTRTTLGELKRTLRQMDVREAREWILQQLTSGEDAATSLDLEIGDDQNLAAWPSYRVFLLDMLFLVDPAASVEPARVILQSEGSPDEWAIAMRNLARASTESVDNALLREKSAQLLRNAGWLKNPTSGCLEAFDVIVHTRNASLTPDLLRLCDDRDQKAARHASFLTLDRLVQANPKATLTMLAAQASAHPQNGLMISNMMARADVRDEAQRQALEGYLLDTHRTAEELRGFASVFPNANIAVSNNLLTKPSLIHGRDLADQDQASMKTLEAWLADQRFSKLQEPLLQALGRLQELAGTRNTGR